MNWLGIYLVGEHLPTMNKVVGSILELGIITYLFDQTYMCMPLAVVACVWVDMHVCVHACGGQQTI